MTNRNLVPESTQGTTRLQSLIARGKALREAQAGTVPTTGTEDTSFFKTLMRPLVTPEMVEQLPGWLQPVGTIGRELTSPTQLALLALTAGYGPAISAALRGGTGAVGVARGLAAGAIAPVVRAPFPVRFAAEAGLVGGAEAGILGAEKLTEDAPTPLQIGAGIVGGLAGGIGAVGAIRGLAGARGFPAQAVREAIPVARGAEELIPGSGITSDTILPGHKKRLSELSSKEILARLGKRLPRSRRRIYEAVLKRRPDVVQYPARRTRYEQGIDKEGVPEGVLDTYVAEPRFRGKGFFENLREVRRTHPYGAAVEVKDPAFYSDPTTRIYLVPDNSAGVAVTPGGDLVSVYKRTGSTHKIDPILNEASKESRTLDAYDIKAELPNLYARHGFRPAARVRFNPDYAPEGWNYELLGEPDIVLMVRDVDGLTGLREIPVSVKGADGVRRGGYEDIMDDIPIFDDFDEALKVRDAVLRQQQPISGTRLQLARAARLQLSIRSTKREGGGFLISGRDTRGRQVRVFAKTLDEAKAAKENIRQGFEPLPRTEMQAAEREYQAATRAFRRAERIGEPGAIARTRLSLEQAGRAVRSLERTRVDEPPKLPPKIDPDGTPTPPEDWNNARNKLVSVLRGGTMRKTRREIAELRARQGSRVGAEVEAGYQAAAARGEPPIGRIRGAQKGQIEVPELVLSERFSEAEVAVLRDSIYTKLGPELRMTAANIDVALTRLATEGKMPTDSELLWMEEIFGPDMVVALRDLRPRSAKVIEELMKLWNLPRALMASFDDSAVLRQGAMLLPEGSVAWRAWRSHWKVIKASGAQALEDEVRNNQWFNHARAHGVDFTFPSAARGIAGAEEPFMGVGIAEKIWGIGRAVRISERLYSGYLNKLRMDVYAAHAQELTRMKAGREVDRTAAFDELGNIINILSGRASLGKAQAIAPFLNGVFFSARLNWARMQAPLRIFFLQNKSPNVGTPEGRHLARMLARDVYGYYAGVLGMLGLASAAGVAKVEWDSRSADFGKAQIGTVRIDPWAGQQQLAVLIARIATDQRKTTTTRQLLPARDLDTLMRFVESKFHPALSQTLSVKRGETYFGDDLTLGEFATSWYPLFLQDIAEIHEGASPGLATALGIAAFSGVSVYNIPGVPSIVLDQLQDAVDTYNEIPTDTLELAPGQQSRIGYRIRNPQADAALFIAGQVSSLRTIMAVREVASIIQENGINPDMVRGIDQRKETLRKAREVGRRLPRNAVDRLIELLETNPTGGAQRPRLTPEREMAGVS
jgi:hypothetical protein